MSLKNIFRVSTAVLALGLAPLIAAADSLDDRLAALAKAADCQDPASPWRVWCVAADFKKGIAGTSLPLQPLIGYTVRLQDGADFKAALRDQVTLAAFSGLTDGKVLVVDIKPTSKSEEAEVAEAVALTTQVFKDKANLVRLPKGVASYLNSLKGRYPVRNTGAEWEWSGASASKMRKVGKYWVVLETPQANNGLFVTLLTGAWN